MSRLVVLVVVGLVLGFVAEDVMAQSTPYHARMAAQYQAREAQIRAQQQMQLQARTAWGYRVRAQMQLQNQQRAQLQRQAIRVQLRDRDRDGSCTTNTAASASTVKGMVATTPPRTRSGEDNETGDGVFARPRDRDSED